MPLNPKVSVLIPTYNRQKFVVPCIESILNQTYQDFEILIYDDGSTDNTKFMIETLKDKRIKYFESAENRGVSYARNRLLDLCETDIATWQDSDDLSNKYRLERQYAITKKYSFCVVNSRFFTDPKEIKIDEQIEDQMNYEFPVITGMFEVKEVPRFDEKLRYGEDVLWGKQMIWNKIRDYQIGYYIRFHSDRLGVNKNK